MDMIKKRQIELDQGINKDRFDLMTILLQDEVFQNNYDMIIDETLTFFAAGSTTTAAVVANLIQYLAMVPNDEKRLREEMKTIFKNWGQSNEELAEEINLDSGEELNFLKMCFNESLRLEPPVPFSSTVTITEDQTLGEIKVKAGERIVINVHQMHHNKEEWI